MRVYNDLTRQKEELTPQEDNHFKVYVCGPTVYDYFHLGNARPFIVYDTLRRYLEYSGYDVTYVQNFTDVDDKMIQRANLEKITIAELAEKMIAAYYEDADALNIRRATHHPRATETIAEIVDMIELIEQKGYAYLTADGVYFDTHAYPDYGKLSRRETDEEEAETVNRVDSSDDKRHQADFALWKFKKEGEPFWPSPWGEGRPGWHIECSAMNKKFLGETVDIHGGGQDLIFPHHENEIAQSEAANGKPFVRYWMHNGFVNVDNEKMAKSGGNFFLVRDLAKKFPHEVLRFFMLQAHYRMPINFASDLLEAAQHGWERIKTCVAHLDFLLQHCGEGDLDEAASARISDFADQTVASFKQAMDDDLNTADACAAIFDLVREVNTVTADSDLSETALQAARGVIVELCAVLGLDPTVREEAIPAEIMQLVDERARAKKERNFAEADRIRNYLTEQGYRVEDTPQGPKVSRA